MKKNKKIVEFKNDNYFIKQEEELLKKIDHDKRYIFLVKEIIFLEKKLEELKKFPFIVVNPKDRRKQKTTAAWKQYKECEQQYQNALKNYNTISKREEEKDNQNPFEIWMKNRINDKYENR